MRWSLCWLPPSGDPKCFGTSKVSILAIASITFSSNQKELSVNYENNSPPDVARRRIAVLGYKSKSEVEGGINWIKGFLPLLWKAAGTFLSALSHPNTRNNSFGSTTGDWRLQKHPVNEIKPWIYCVFLQKKYAVAQNIKFNSKRKRMTFCTKLRLQIWTFRNLASDSHRAQTSKIFDSTLRLLSHSPSLTFVWQLLTKSYQEFSWIQRSLNNIPLKKIYLTSIHFQISINSVATWRWRRIPPRKHSVTLPPSQVSQISATFLA